MVIAAAAKQNPLRVLAAMGRTGLIALGHARGGIEHLSGIWSLFASTIYYCTFGPLTGRSRLARQLFPMMSNVGVRSSPIVALISALMGAVLVLQTGDLLKEYGQISEVGGLVARSMTLELGPLMTAIIMAARVGASFTAVLASMKINEEILALETMAIHPVGFLVAPRFLSMLVMVPCLTLFSYFIGMIGGGVVAARSYDIAISVYILKSVSYLDMWYVMSGLLKAVVFSVIISVVCCYHGFITTGGPMGLGRSTMVAVVTSLVVIIIADTLLTALVINYII